MKLINKTQQARLMLSKQAYSQINIEQGVLEGSASRKNSSESQGTGGSVVKVPTVPKNEQNIDFLPTYKMSQTEHTYLNKNNQAPSYCDRVLFKSNKPVVWSADFYRS